MLKQRYANHTDFTENLASNVIKFSVYLDTVFFEIQEIKRMSWSELIGSLGGYFHLLLGMIILSFVELFEILFLCTREGS